MLDYNSRAQQNGVGLQASLDSQKFVDIPLCPYKSSGKETGFWAGKPNGKVTRQTNCQIQLVGSTATNTTSERTLTVLPVEIIFARQFRRILCANNARMERLESDVRACVLLDEMLDDLVAGSFAWIWPAAEETLTTTLGPEDRMESNSLIMWKVPRTLVSKVSL